MAKIMYVEECINSNTNEKVSKLAKKQLLTLLDEKVKLQQALERIVKAQYDNSTLSNLNSMVREGRDVLINLD